jgi:protein SCO1/2
VNLARDALGPGSFNVLTVGFDTANDTPARMRLYARERGAVMPDWVFASTDSATMTRLMRDVGFSYKSSPKGFDHIIQTTIIDPDGRVVLQVYGQDFRPPTLIEPLKRLIRGQALERGSLSDLVRSVKLLCTIYDPSSGKYRFNFSLIVEIIAGVLALGMMAVAIILSWRNVH